jgi:LuxR family transcriptional regulator
MRHSDAISAWGEDLLVGISRAKDLPAAFAEVLKAARTLGFDYCAYGMRASWGPGEARIFLLNNYAPAWNQRYQAAGYLEVDPTVIHGRRSQAALCWTEELFSHARPMWEEAQSFGLRSGWALSSLDGQGVGGMLTLARADRCGMNSSELAANEFSMRWLSSIAHVVLSRHLTQLHAPLPNPPLTPRELEVLRLSAAGETAKEIANALNVSLNTANFHIKNAVTKLVAPNKTAAAVKAAMLGLLN